MESEQQLSKTEIAIIASYRRLSMARKVLAGTNDPVCACRLCRIFGAESVELLVGNPGTAWYHRVQHCKKPWLCPICSLNLSKRRRAQMANIIKDERSTGRGAALLSYTLAHTKSDSLKSLLGCLRAAHKALHSGAGWQSIAKPAGWVGSIRAIEITYGANGWHPHIHEIAFFENDGLTPARRIELLDPLRDRWLMCLARFGGQAERDLGLDIRPAYGSVQDYVGKWGIVPELVNGGFKTPKRGGYSPFQLLDIVADRSSRSSWAQSVFYEYFDATHGVRQLVPSPQYRSRMVIKDEDHADERDDLVLAQFDTLQWADIWERGLRADVLLAARAGVLDDYLNNAHLMRL